MACVKSKLYYKVTILPRHYRKKDHFYCHFSIHVIPWEIFYPNLCYNLVCYIGTALYGLILFSTVYKGINPSSVKVKIVSVISFFLLVLK